MNRINGKAITLKTGTKFYAGVTEVNWDSAAKVEKSLIKEDAGVEMTEIIGFDESFTISGIICINATGDAASHIDWSGLRTAYKAAAPVAFVYGMGVSTDPEVTGNLLILSLSEKSGSTGKATYTAKCDIVQDSNLHYGVTV